MDVFSFAKKMLKREFNKCISYSIVLLVALIISFIFTDFIDNPLLIENDPVIGAGTFREMSIPLSKGLPFIVIALCWVMILYASNYYLSSQTDSFALLLISGGNIIDVAKFVLWQVAIMFIGIVPVALLLGTGILKLIYMFMFSYLGIDVVYKIPITTYINVLLSLVPILMAICVAVAGFSHRNTLQVLLGRAEANKKVKIKKHNKSSLIYIVIYLWSISLVFFQKHQLTAYIFPAAVGVISIYGLFKRTIPKIIQMWKNKGGLEKERLYISLSNYVVSLQGTIIFSMLMLVLVCGLIPVLISQDKITNEYITGLISYIVMAILIVVGIVYKFIDNMMIRKNEFVCLNRIGYTKKEIKKIIRQEVIIYYCTIIFLPLPLVLSIGTRYIMNNDLTVLKLMILIAIYIIPIILSIFVTYNLYLKFMIKKENQAV